MKISSSLLNYLKSRGITGEKNQLRFLFPRLAHHYDPFILEGVREAVGIIADSIKRQKKILIWGDADLDGISSTVLMKTALQDLGAKELEIRIPPKGGEGFGLISDDLKRFKESGGDLVITVDVGLTNVDEASLASQIGLDLIITDHHELVGSPPQTIVINPKLPASKYPFRNLSGAGVAFKLVSALYSQMVKLTIEELADLRPQYWTLAALGTISDRCPLIDENRLIVKQGLANLRKGGWKSVDIWLETMGLEAEKLSVFDLYSRGISAFYAADPEEAVRLMFSTDSNLLRLKFSEFKEIAQSWQRGKQKMIEEARNSAQIVGGIVISISESLDQDYLGTSAHALREINQKPAIVFSPQDELWHAECRGLDDTNLLSYLSRFKDLFLTFGGHRKACGFTLKKEKIDELLERISSRPIGETAEPESREEMVVELKISKNNITEWMLLAPFGEGNPAPRLMTRGVILDHKDNSYYTNGLPVFLPSSLRSLPDYNNKFDLEYTINGDGTVRILSLTPVA